jgi:transcriptional regulator of acetoin/glycerol metabolism
LKKIAGNDNTIQNSLNRVARLLNVNMSFLIQGETGTGKEFIAKAIHLASARAHGPFVPVNCAALPETLIESELFGYEGGSFTGAMAKGKKGLVREAQGGTLFLDEIGDMPLGSQTRLLRVLSEREVTPIGGAKAHTVDIRVIAATHCNLKDKIQKGQFREDLYFRLNGAIVHMPPLRERQDFEWLVNQLLARDVQAQNVSLSPDAMAILKAYHWPGNVRELINALDYARALAQGPVIEAEDLPEYVTAPRSSAGAAEPAGEGVNAVSDAETLKRALKQSQGNISAAARLMGIDRTTMHRRMRRLGVSLPPRSL